MHAMSGKAEALRKSFHDACVQAVRASLWPSWSKSNTGPESWTACFQRRATTATQVLSLRLAQKRHVVEIVLAVKRDPAGPMPRVWWEDRALHREATGYAKVLWSGELKCSSEQSIPVPREPWSSEFATAIEEQLAANRTAMESWYDDAEPQISTGDA
jgi:hypothetical protein